MDNLWHEIPYIPVMCETIEVILIVSDKFADQSSQNPLAQPDENTEELLTA